MIHGDGAIFYEDAMLRIVLVEQPFVLRLIGQADLSHRRVIDSMLQRAERASGDVLIDVSGLRFIDVGRARQMVDVAGLLNLYGRNVRIVGVRPSVLRIFQVCMWPKPPNLRLEALNGKVGTPVDLPSQADQQWRDRDDDSTGQLQLPCLSRRIR